MRNTGYRTRVVTALLALGLMMGGGIVYMRCQQGRGHLAFDGQRAYQHALAQCEQGPRPSGSEAGWATGDYIIQQLEKAGWKVTTQEFDYRGVKIRNILGQQGEGPPMILGAHYDTRRLADQDPHDPGQPVPGGNDGASGVAVLLELAHTLNPKMLHNEVWIAFFDAEDNGGLDGWPWSVGATYMAEHLTIRPEAVIVVDMVGDADQQLYQERNSNRALVEQIWTLAAHLGYDEQFIPRYKWSMTDDHTPFLQHGIPAVDIIDFDYPYWHTVEDTCDKVSPESLERVGRVLEEWLEGR
jgi:Zn-dependent M28 family amino/carboxypeptidase